LAVARTERANIDAALAWSVRHDPHRALSIALGFGWSWIVLGDARGAQRIASALAAAGDAATEVERIDALLQIGWIEASIGDLAPARDHVSTAARLAEEIDDAELCARADFHLAYVVSHEGGFREGLELTDRANAVYETLDRAWERAANGLFMARAAISAGDESRSIQAAALVESALTGVGDPWLHVRADAMLGELARLQRRFADAVVHIGRAAATSSRLGFAQTEAYQVASLGRAQGQAGDDTAAAATLRLAVEKAEATGDVRMAALARIHLGRILRALGEDAAAREVLEHTVAWHRRAGGGEQALLGECLLAALDGDESRLVELADRARTVGDAPAAVIALDAMARVARERGEDAAAAGLTAEADANMRQASHFISDRDRVDRERDADSAYDSDISSLSEISLAE
jgi:hypothetical protein